VALGVGYAQTASLDFLNHNRPILDAHNGYPYQGQWTNRIDRALGTGFPVSIEQDLTWDRKGAKREGRIVLSHTHRRPRAPNPRCVITSSSVCVPRGEALADNDRAHWPLIILHFDFHN
jgi:hypothetical protein